MRTVVLLLSLATLGLSLACGYLYRELQAARSHADGAPSHVSESSVAAGPPPSKQVETAPSIEASQPRFMVERSIEQPTPTEPTATRANRREELRAERQRRRADPAWRARALARTKSQVREDTPDLGSALELDASQEAAFVELLAEHEMQRDEAYEPMRSATDAERSAIQEKSNALAAQHQQEISQFLGAARFAQYQDYVREVPERQQLRELRSRLDESFALTDAQSARLIDAMHQERDSYLQQLKSLEANIAYSPQYPLLVMRTRGDADARVRFAEEQVARTEAFMSRIRLRASEVLSAEQLRRFDEIQEEQTTLVQVQLDRVRRQAERARNRENQR